MLVARTEALQSFRLALEAPPVRARIAAWSGSWLFQKRGSLQTSEKRVDVMVKRWRKDNVGRSGVGDNVGCNGESRLKPVQQF